MKLRLDFLGEAHANHEWRYAHLDHPPHMERKDWIIVAEWALRSSITAVAADGKAYPDCLGASYGNGR